MPGWQEKALKRRGQIIPPSVPADWRVSGPHTDLISSVASCLTAEEKAITAMTASELLPKLRSRQITSHQVTLAFCHAAAVAHTASGCLTALLYDQALQHAQRLDERLAKHGPVGPLHGLPISVKDSLCVEGTDSTLGLVSLLDDISSEDAPVVAKLRELGAVIYCKTAASAATMSCDMESNLFGRTLNGVFPDLISGSSSGGEATAVALHASPLGVGTDLGGSLRFPAAFQNLYSFKPLSGEFSNVGVTSVLPDVPDIESTIGPISRNPRDLLTFMQAMSSWHDSNFTHSKKIIVLREGIMPLTSEVSSAFQAVCSKLSTAGWSLTEWQLSLDLYGRASDIVGDLFHKYGSVSIQEAIEKGEEPWPPRLASFRDTDPDTLPSVAVLRERAAEIREQLIAEFAAQDVDFILAPITAHAGYAWGVDEAGDGSYTGVWNLCNFAAATFPAVPGKPIGFQLVGPSNEATLAGLLDLHHDLLSE